MANWVFIEQEFGLQPIADTSTTQNHTLGKIARARHTPTANNQGAGEFIYLKGVASTIVGSIVTYDPVNATTTLAPATAGLNQPVAIAMSANVASQYGWYQIAGAAVIGKTTIKFSPSVPVYLSGSGLITSTAASGKQVVGARSVNAATVVSATTTVLVLINRPAAQGSAV